MNLWRNDNRKCRLENSSTKVRLWHTRETISWVSQKSICTIFSWCNKKFKKKKKKYLENIWRFFYHQKAINLSSVDSRRLFFTMKMQPYACVCFLLSLPFPFPIHCLWVFFFSLFCQIPCCFVVLFWCATLKTNSNTILHSNNKQT